MVGRFRLLRQDGGYIVVRLARVDDERQTGAPRRLDVRAKSCRLRVARGEDPDRPVDAAPPPTQPSFFGGMSEADRRAARAVVQVQERLGVDAVGRDGELPGVVEQVVEQHLRGQHRQERQEQRRAGRAPASS